MKHLPGCVVRAALKKVLPPFSKNVIRNGRRSIRWDVSLRRNLDQGQTYFHLESTVCNSAIDLNATLFIEIFCCLRERASGHGKQLEKKTGRKKLDYAALSSICRYAMMLTFSWVIRPLVTIGSITERIFWIRSVLSTISITTGRSLDS